MAACGGVDPAAPPSQGGASTGPASTGVVVTLYPPSASVDACQTADFGASVTGTTSQDIVWTVKEGASGGTVTTAGVYTAPSAPGTYHVVAASAADSTKAVEGAVTVGPEKVLSVAIAPGNGTALTNGTLAFSALVTTSCGTFSAQ